MSEPTAGRPMDEDLAQAYERAQALAGDGRGPAASVRANVLAAAARIAQGEDAAAAAPPLVRVAPPVAQVGRGREGAINLSSWRVRSGAALCALLLVCAGIWRVDQNGRLAGGVQVALAELRLDQPRTAPAQQDLPLPAAAAPASFPYAAPPPVVVDPLDAGSTRGAIAKKAERESKDVVIAQLEAQRMAPAAKRAPAEPDALARDRAAPPAGARAADAAAAPPPVALASKSAAEQELTTTVTITAAAPTAPPQIVTSPPHAPSVLPRRMMLVPRPSSAPSAGPATRGNTAVALADTADKREVQRMEIAPSASARSAPTSPAAAPVAPPPVAAPPTVVAAAAPAPGVVEGNAAAPPESKAGFAPDADAAKRAKVELTGIRADAPRPTLQSAADRGDVGVLKTLLADPAVRVDAPDADGRTALLHAVLAQRAAAVRLLLAAGADPAHADRAGLTPRQAAQTGASAEIAVLLAAPR